MTIAFIAMFIACLGFIFVLDKKQVSFNRLVIIGLITGIVLGIILYKFSPESAPDVLRWTGLIGNIYVRLLKMMSIPLVFVSVVCAIINPKSQTGIKKTTLIILIVLLSTVAIAASVSGVIALGFNLSAEGMEMGDEELNRAGTLEERSKNIANIEQTILDIIPSNPVYAISGQGVSATLSVVFFACMLGVAIRAVSIYKEEDYIFIKKLLNAANTVTVEIVMVILKLTPYGIASLIMGSVAGSDYNGLWRLAKFVIASYIAIAVMFIIHGLILALFGISPIIFFKKAMTALTFAFTSSTSAGTLPLTIHTLIEKMGVSKGTANLGSSLAVSVGQNGCGAVYPAMLVIMIAPVVGQEITIAYFIKVIIVITISSIGIAGVGGGATFAGIAVLNALGLPIGIAGLLIAAEPMIDMARTALNVSDAMVASLIAGKLTKNIDMNVYKSK